MNRKQKTVILFLLFVVLSLIVLGIPRTEIHDKDLRKVPAETLNENGETKANTNEDLLKRQADQKPDFKELRKRAIPKLSPEEEHQLKLADYNAYIRYRAQLEQPERLDPASKEEIIQERIAPKLLEQLKKNRETKSAK